MQTIPKIIHYVWVGPNDLTPLAEECIASWKKYLPDYEIKFWNETNSPMNHSYVEHMYGEKKWAFVSDYIRFRVLKKYGGIYLDTDMELLRPLDDFLDEEMFVGRSKTGDIESSIIGVVPNHPAIDSALTFYDTDTSRSISNTSPKVLAEAIASCPETATVFPAKYFHPCDEGEKCTQEKLKDSYARHHWAESWVPYRTLRKILRKTGLLKLVKKFL